MSCSARRMRERVAALGVDPRIITVIPNWGGWCGDTARCRERRIPCWRMGTRR